MLSATWSPIFFNGFKAKINEPHNPAFLLPISFDKLKIQRIVIIEKIWLESGSSTPFLREVLEALQSITGSTMRVSLGELAGGKKIRLQIVEEAADQIEPPNIWTKLRL